MTYKNTHRPWWMTDAPYIIAVLAAFGAVCASALIGVIAGAFIGNIFGLNVQICVTWLGSATTMIGGVIATVLFMEFQLLYNKNMTFEFGLEYLAFVWCRAYRIQSTDSTSETTHEKQDSLVPATFDPTHFENSRN